MNTKKNYLTTVVKKKKFVGRGIGVYYVYVFFKNYNKPILAVIFFESKFTIV